MWPPPPPTHITKPLARGGPSWAEGKDSGPGADSLPASLLMAPVTAPACRPRNLALPAQPV